jgi:hypothetical protein
MDRLEQRELARLRARSVRVVKLARQDRYLARSRTYEPGSYFELWVSPWGHVHCTCPGFTYRGICTHAEALKAKAQSERWLAGGHYRQQMTGCCCPHRCYTGCYAFKNCYSRRFIVAML